MKYQIVFSREAEEDLERLFDFAFGRKLNSPTGVLENRQACQFLAISPFSCRKKDEEPFVRELILPFAEAQESERLVGVELRRLPLGQTTEHKPSC